MKTIDDSSPRILTSHAIIRFQDCDPYSHLNNGRYLDYFMNAREDQVWKEYDFNIYEYTRESGMGWVVAQNQIAYLRPAVLMETVKIESQLTGIKPKFLQVEMRMFDAQDLLKSLLWVRFIHVDILQGKSVAHGDALQSAFEKLCLPVKESEFDLRLKTLTGRS